MYTEQLKAEINEYVSKDNFILKAAKWIQLLRSR